MGTSRLVRATLRRAPARALESVRTEAGGVGCRRGRRAIAGLRAHARPRRAALRGALPCHGRAGDQEGDPRARPGLARGDDGQHDRARTHERSERERRPQSRARPHPAQPLVPALHPVPSQPDQHRAPPSNRPALRRQPKAARAGSNDHGLPLMDVALRALFLYAFIVFVMRVIGRRELSSLSAIDLVLLIVLGDAIQQGLTQDDYSVTGAVIAVSTIAAVQVGTSYLSFRP